MAIDRTPGRTARVRARARIYLAVSAILLISTVALSAAYFTEPPPPPQPAAALGVIPSAGTGDHSASQGRAVADTAAEGDAPPAPRYPHPGAQPATAPLTTSPAPVPAFTLPASVPTSIHAPAVGVQSPLLQVGRNTDGTIEVPADYHTAAWYRLGPAPGSLGPAVIVGHVDSYKGPGVFFDLGATQPGQVIEITRADGGVARVRVDAVNSYPKDQFPTDAVYGSIDYAGLRVITCGGVFDRTTKSYESNTVVFASLIRG